MQGGVDVQSSIVLRAKELSYSVIQKSGLLKHILSKVTISFCDGSTYALMGPSGSGKSTLLDLLAGHKHRGIWSGKMSVNGATIPPLFSRYSAYVLQDDLHCSLLTVEETLRFAAWLRLEDYETCDPLFIESRVDLVLDMVGLKPVRKSVVGDQLSRGISGGQLKRLSIGTEIVNLPRVIFLDEPTSGLDSQLASEVMSSIRRLAGEGRICIATVHQPSKEMFFAFDSIALLAEGRLIYSGPPENAIPYFTSSVQGFIYPEGVNPADFLINICGGKAESTRNTSIVELAKLCSYTRALSVDDVDYGREFEMGEETFWPSPKEYLRGLFREDRRTGKYAASAGSQFLILCYRNWIINCRNIADIRSQLLKNIFIALLVGAIFHNQAAVKMPLYIDGVQQSSVNSVNSLLFFGMVYILIANAEAIPSLVSKDRFYRREQAACRYSAGPYWLSHILSALPWMMLYLLVFLIPSYILCGYPLDADYFAYFFFVLLVGNMTSYYFATYLAAATGNEVTAFAIFPMSFVFLANFAGYSISIKDIPIGWIWAPSVSYARWIFEGLMINQWDRAPFNRASDDSNGLAVLSHYGFDNFGRMECLLIVAWFAVASAVAAYFPMRRPASKLMKVRDVTSLVGISTWSQRYSSYVDDQITKSKRFARRITGSASGRLNENKVTPRSTARSGLSSMGPSKILSPGRLVVGDNDLEAPLLEEQLGDILEMEGAATPRKSKYASDIITDRVNPTYDNVDNGALESKEYDGSESESEHSASKDVDWFRSHSKVVQQDAMQHRTDVATMNIDSGGNDASTVGTELVFKNISYEVPVGVGSWNTETTQILHRVSGYACTGQLLALMGASGAGKTTLLDIIAGRKSFGHVSGDIYLNGKNQNHILSSRLHSSAYVTQDSVHLPELTVRETLEFAAALRLDESMASSEMRMRVEQMLELLDLSDHAETIVGDEKHRGISGGQRKRVSIAVEIMHLPTLLFMDEPTTGLDSARALEVISFARAFADRDRVVICTIHQPSPHICELFDNLLLLSNGRMVYFGPFRNAVEFFVTSPFEFSVGEGVTNPAEFLIAVASSSVVSSSGVNISSTHLASYFEETSTFATMIRSINNLIDGTTITSKEGEPAVGLRPSVNGYYLLSNAARRTFSWKLSSWSIFRRVSYPTSTVNQIRVLCYRVLLCTYRNRLPIILTTLRHVAIGLLYGSLFYNMGDSLKPTAYTNRLSLLFFSLNFVIVTHQQMIPTLFESRLLFYRERSSKCYGALPYWISTWFLQVPLAAVNVLLFSVIIFSLTDLHWGGDAANFWFFYGVAYASSLTGLFMCQLIAAITPTAQSAFSYFPMAYFVNMAFGGYIVYLPSLAPWLKHWAPLLSFLRFSFQAIALSEFENNDKVPLGSRYMTILGFNTMSRYQCAPITVVYLVTFAVALLLALRIVSFERR